MLGSFWMWTAGAWLGITALKIFYLPRLRPPAPLLTTKRGFLAVGAIVLPIGRYIDPASRPASDPTTEVCLSGFEASLDGAQGVALLCSLWREPLMNSPMILAGLYICVSIGRASGFWSTLRRLKNGSRRLKSPL
jgi:hypothetical protein